VSEIDANKIAAEVIGKALSESAKSITGTLRDFFSKVRENYNKSLKGYLATSIDRCSHIKTPIINRDRPTYLFDIYVHTQIQVREKILQDDDFIPMLVGMKSAVISGNAGSGKSMFMRYLFISLCEGGFGKIPLFIELRNLNSFALKDLLAFIYYSVVGTGGVLNQEQFDEGLKHGTFSVILDGFDEIDVDQRKNIEKQILTLREKYPDILLIISSRPDPDNRFYSWNRFHVCQVCPMTQKQAAALIQKIDYDADVKRKFLKAMRENLFETHESFLSNPLLCIMMLVTFKQTGHIPDKMHIFYEQAFDALFYLHDAAKEGVYRRKTYAALSIDEFRNFLAAFCVVSYAKERFSFSGGELRQDILQALDIEKKKVDTANLISDLVESTCLLQMEGTEYSFTHRSFQEYFTANFIVRSPASGLPALLDQFSRRREDDVMKMAFAMNKNLLEREWVIPKLKLFLEKGVGIDPEVEPLRYVETVFGPLELRYRRNIPDIFSYREVSPMVSVAAVLMDIYTTEFESTVKWNARETKRDVQRIGKVLEKMRADGDSRIEVIPGKRASISLLPIEKSDGWWLKDTRIPGYFSRQRRVFQKLLHSIEKDVKNQQDVLISLLTPVEDGPTSK
jgi:hypothetical protein